MAPRTLLIPSLLDDWFPLLRHAFASDRWDPVLLTEANPQLAELGLRYFHNELCYPVFLIAGQVLSALGSGRYDPRRCGVLLGQAGDECRGSCGIRLLRQVLDRAGYPEVALLSLNVRDIDRDTGLPITVQMIRRALAAAVWGGYLNHSFQNAVFEGIRMSCQSGLHGWEVTDLKVTFTQAEYYLSLIHI